MKFGEWGEDRRKKKVHHPPTVSMMTRSRRSRKDPAHHYEDPPSRAAQQPHTCHSTTNHPLIWTSSTQTLRLENNLSYFIFCPIPSVMGHHKSRGIECFNWNDVLKLIFFFQIFTRLSQITKSEMGLLRFLFYVAMNEFPAEYLSIIFFETIFRGSTPKHQGNHFRIQTTLLWYLLQFLEV